MIRPGSFVRDHYIHIGERTWPHLRLGDHLGEGVQLVRLVEPADLKAEFFGQVLYRLPDWCTQPKTKRAQHGEESHSGSCMLWMFGGMQSTKSHDQQNSPRPQQSR